MKLLRLKQLRLNLTKLLKNSRDSMKSDIKFIFNFKILLTIPIKEKFLFKEQHKNSQKTKRILISNRVHWKKGNSNWRGKLKIIRQRMRRLTHSRDF